MAVVHESVCPDAGPQCRAGAQPAYVHDQRISIAELRTVTRYAFSEVWAAEVQLAARLVQTGIQYRWLDGAPFTPPFPNLHHRNETLFGLLDPWVSALARVRAGRHELSLRLGFTVPVAGATNLGVRDLLNQLVALRDALATADGAAIAVAQADLINGEDTFISAMAENGAVQLRIEMNQSQQESRADSLVSLVSAETSADLPDTIVRLNQAQTAYQAALQSAASIMRISLLDYIK